MEVVLLLEEEEEEEEDKYWTNQDVIYNYDCNLTVTGGLLSDLLRFFFLAHLWVYQSVCIM